MHTFYTCIIFVIERIRKIRIHIIVLNLLNYNFLLIFILLYSRYLICIIVYKNMTKLQSISYIFYNVLNVYYFTVIVLNVRICNFKVSKLFWKHYSLFRHFMILTLTLFFRFFYKHTQQ